MSMIKELLKKLEVWLSTKGDRFVYLLSVTEVMLIMIFLSYQGHTWLSFIAKLMLEMVCVTIFNFIVKCRIEKLVFKELHIGENGEYIDN